MKANEAFGQNDFEEFLKYCSGDLQWTMVGDRSVTGTDDIRGYMNAMGPSEISSLTVDYIISEGDRAACKGNFTMQTDEGTQQYEYCDVYRFRDEKITELTSFVIRFRPNP